MLSFRDLKVWIPMLFLFLVQMAASELVFLQSVWRHGDRSPALLIPTDVGNPLTSWPQGLGELTQKGMREHYGLGQWIRTYYGHFLSKNYSAFEIHVRSTNYNRTIMSAMSNMAGLFPPAGKQVWNASILWQPVPIHTLPLDEDPLLYEQYPCPKEDKYYNDVIMRSPAVLKIMSDNKDFLDFVRHKTGLPIHILGLVYKANDPLHCEKQHEAEHPLPGWVNESVYQKLGELADISTGYYCPNDEAKKLRGGVLVTDLIERMQKKAAGDTALDHRLKYHAYSAHDTTLIVLLSTLGVFNARNPPYASAVFLELHKDNGVYTVKILFRNDTSDGHYLAVPGCGSPCRLDTLASLMSKYHVEREEVDALCRGEGRVWRYLDSVSTKGWLWTCGALSTAVLGLIILVAFLGRQYIRDSDVPYSRLPAPLNALVS